MILAYTTTITSLRIHQQHCTRAACRFKNQGTISVNAAYSPDDNLPFSGYKQSGTGRELDNEGLMAYLQAKSIKIYVGQ